MGEREPFSVLQVMTFKEKFAKMSMDGKNVSKDDLTRLLQLVGQNPTQKQVRDALKEHNLYHALSITYEQFEKIVWTVMNDSEIENELRDLFKKFDNDGNGVLDHEEFKTAMLSYGDTFTVEEIERVIEMLDVDGDGTIDYEEFVKAMIESEEADGDA